MNTRFHELKAHVLLLLVGTACATDASDAQSSAANAGAAASVTATATASTNASAEVNAPAPVPISPTLGGSVLSVGQYQVELAVFVDGGIEGLVYDAQGTAVPAELVTELSAAFGVDGNAKANAKLVWEAATKRFEGKHSLDAKLVGRPIDVTLVLRGKTQSGVLAAYTPLPRPKLEGSAQLYADAPSPALAAKGKLGSGAKATLSSQTPAAAKTSAKAGASATGSAKLDVPTPKLVVSTQSSAGKDKPGAAASVKAKVKLGFGN